MFHCRYDKICQHKGITIGFTRMSAVTHYTVLGIQKTSTPEEIKQAYRRLAMRWHPDRQGGGDSQLAEVKFKEIKFAYEVLIDDVKRLAYDKTITSTGGESKNSRSNPHTGGTWTESDGYDNAFAEYRKTLPRGKDIIQNVSLEIKEAQFGCEFEVEDGKTKNCDQCHGYGGTKHRCSECHGTGNVVSTKGKYGCTVCDGFGFKKIVCDTCRGTGKKSGSSAFRVKIPGGVINDSRIVIEGKGKDSQHGGLPGNLIISIRVKVESPWVCDGADLLGKLELNFSTALLGGEVTIDVPTGKRLQISIKPMTDSKKLIKLTGKGLSNKKTGQVGDIILETVIVLPKAPRISQEMERLIRQIDNMS
jgi:molecular chaperone DnaJ